MYYTKTRLADCDTNDVEENRTNSNFLNYQCVNRTEFPVNPLPDKKILDSSKLKEFADNNFKFHENERKLSKQVENTVGKGEITHYEQFLLFPQCFQRLVSQGPQKVTLCVNGLTLSLVVTTRKTLVDSVYQDQTPQYEQSDLLFTLSTFSFYTRFQKKSGHFVFGDFPLPIMLNVHVFGTKIKIRTCALKS